MVVDALGQALRFLTPGQRHDMLQVSTFFQGFEYANVIVDKGCDSNALIDQIQDQNCISVIPCRSNRKVQREYDTFM